MTNSAKLHNLELLREELFKEFCLSLKPGDEKLNRLTHREDVSVDDIAKISDSLYQKLASAFGKALTLKIWFGGDLLYTLKGTFNQSALDKFRLELRSGDIVGVVKVDLDLDKRSLIDKILESPEGVIATIIFNPSVLVNVLSDPIMNLDRRTHESTHKDDIFFDDDNAKQVVLIPNLDVWINGDRLAIIGGKGFKKLDEILVPPASGASEIQQMRRLSELNVKWIRLDPPRLTPLHFAVEVNESLAKAKAKELLDLLSWLRVILSLMYLSDSTSCDINGSFIITFGGAGGSSQMNVPSTLPKDHNFRQILRKSSIIISEECLWAYSDKRRVMDRLVTVQSVIAQVLPGPDYSTHMRELLHSADTVHSFISEHWKIFCEGEVDKYFDKIQQISEFITAATRSYGEQIDSLIKSLSTTMLGAVVLVVGTFIGSLLSEKFNLTIFIIGLSTYTGYLAIFPGLFGMSSAWQHFIETRDRMHQQYEDLKKRIRFPDKNKWNSLKKQLLRSEQRFKSWFWATAVAYGLVCTLGVVAILILVF